MWAGLTHSLLFITKTVISATKTELCTPGAVGSLSNMLAIHLQFNTSYSLWICCED